MFSIKPKVSFRSLSYFTNVSRQNKSLDYSQCLKSLSNNQRVIKHNQSNSNLFGQEIAPQFYRNTINQQNRSNFQPIHNNSRNFSSVSTSHVSQTLNAFVLLTSLTVIGLTTVEFVATQFTEKSRIEYNDCAHAYSIESDTTE